MKLIFCRKHVVFGKVVEGLDILKKIEAVPTSGQRNKPDEPIKIVDCGEVLRGKENGVISVKDGKSLLVINFVGLSGTIYGIHFNNSIFCVQNILASIL
jgi:hypothetical protein